ncbi:feruloyl esterase B [Schizothecium vesticola]|uniref:Carboxylic ester hydrolase n=1 Tax=Schizothecium vesticola TaxID=314040 RepID=A0AA40BRB7_9PEZI|nr:feruloyl esterase B [Schizothecium vesticola]
MLKPQNIHNFTMHLHQLLIYLLPFIPLALTSTAPPLPDGASVLPRQRGLVCRDDTFSDILPASAHIVTIARVANGSSYGESPAQNPAYPVHPTNLPELCALTVNVTTSPTSSFRFGLFLPTKWEYRFLVVGNGGFAGGINWLDMGGGVRYGFAVMSTDTGHNSTSGDVRWALGQKEKQKDFGWRAMHQAIEMSKMLVYTYYSQAPRKSYYSGCSTGGRQGLKEVQVDATSFDGLLVGAPAWWSTNLATWTTKVYTLNSAKGGGGRYLSAKEMLFLGQEVMRQCDGIDGVVDGIISASERCRFDFGETLCGNRDVGADKEACLTSEQVATAKAIYADYVVNGKFLFPGLSLGSEDLWSVLLGQAGPDPRGQEYVKMFLLNNATWDWREYNDSIPIMAAAANPGDLTADQFDISDFRDRGGKIIMYHGDADALIPVKSSDYYYNETAAAMGGISSLELWFRYFHVPGLGHCTGTRVNAPWYFAGGNQAASLGTATYSVPGFEDAQHDALLALVDWVERGKQADSLIATTWNTPSNPRSGVLRQRPLCPYPKSQALRSGGEEKDLKEWTCV